MYILIFVLIGIIIGLLRGGSLTSIFKHPYKHWYFGLIGLIILVVLNYSYYFPDLTANFGAFLPILNFVGFLFLLLMLVFNLDDFFTILIALGLTFDFVVIFINGGYMPVAQAVLNIMPANNQLTQSIFDGINAVYGVLDTETTLLGFFGVIIPVPVLTSIVTTFGTIPGLSIGKILILLGIPGVVQGAMVLSKKEKKETLTPEEAQETFTTKHEQPIPQSNTAQFVSAANETGPTNTRFDSLTEELFFEDNPLPKDPLDKIFAEDDRRQTARVETIKYNRKTKTSTYEPVDIELDQDIDMLTRPIGTGIINTKEVVENLKRSEVQGEESEGFFASEFLKEKVKTEPITTEEIFKQPEPVVETEPVIIQDTVEEPTLQTDHLFFDPEQYKLFINSISDEAFRNELEEKLSEMTKERRKQQKKEKEEKPEASLPEKDESIEETPEVVQAEEEIETEETPEVIQTEEEVETAEIEEVSEELAEPEVKESSAEVKEEQKEVIKAETAVITLDEEETQEEKPKPRKHRKRRKIGLFNATPKKSVTEEASSVIVLVEPQEPTEEKVPAIKEAETAQTQEEKPPVEAESSEEANEPEVQEVIQEESPEDLTVNKTEQSSVEEAENITAAEALEAQEETLVEAESSEEAAEPEVQEVIKEENPEDLTVNKTEQSTVEEAENITAAKALEAQEETLVEAESSKESNEPEVQEAIQEESSEDLTVNKTEQAVIEEAENITADEVLKTPEEQPVQETKPEAISEPTVTEVEQEVKEETAQESEEIQPFILVESEEEEKVSENTDLIPAITQELMATEAEAVKLSQIPEIKEQKENLTSPEAVTSDKIEVQKDESLSEESKEEITDETEPEIQEDSNIIILDGDLSDEELQAQGITLEELKEAMQSSLERPAKRGEFIQDERSGYFVNKAYKEEKANMDRSEEEMMNVWAQVSRENEDRKIKRRRRASRSFQLGQEQSGFGSQNEQKPKNRWEELSNRYSNQTIKAEPTKDVKDMTDEERRAAGYERMTVQVQGKTISFWQKKN